MTYLFLKIRNFPSTERDRKHESRATDRVTGNFGSGSVAMVAAISISTVHEIIVFIVDGITKSTQNSPKSNKQPQ